MSEDEPAHPEDSETISREELYERSEERTKEAREPLFERESKWTLNRLPDPTLKQVIVIVTIAIVFLLYIFRSVILALL